MSIEEESSTKIEVPKPTNPIVTTEEIKTNPFVQKFDELCPFVRNGGESGCEKKHSFKKKIFLRTKIAF